MAAVPTTPPRAASGVGSEVGPPLDSAVPPVVAVVVTCNPGWWLEPCLASLAAQDYPELSVLVVDADSDDDPTARVAAVMPGAFVRRIRRRRGFGAAANEVLGVVEGASHFVFCHDDVVLEPGAVRGLVEEAFRSNAGVVAPKLVGWFAPERLLAAGMGADHFGVPVALVERGELDQEQHDAVREVFFAPSACSLVRADLFKTLGGFDAAYGAVGEDLDLSWRVHLASARVVFAPGAVVRHLEATEGGQRALDGGLRAAGPDAESRARDLGLAAAAVPDDPGADPGLAAAPLAPEDAAVVPAVLAGGAPDEVVWDLSRWDEEEAAEIADAAAASAARHAGHHASWRARRDAERTTSADTWTGDDDDWEVDSWSSRRRTRKVAAARERQANREARAGRAGFRRAPRPAPVERLRGPDADELDDRRAEARLRAVATNYSTPRLATRLPLLLLLTVLEALVRLVRRGPHEAARALRPWAALVRQSGPIRVRRRAVRRTRASSDRAVARLQVAGTVRLRQALRAVAVPDSDSEGDGESRSRRVTALVWLGALAVIVLGSRRVLTGPLPTIGGFGPWPALGTLWRYATSGWRTTGLGSAGPAPAAFGLLSVAGAVVLGHTTLLEHLLVVGMLPLGALGAARLARSLPSRRAPLVGLVAYLAVPLPYNALATGNWAGLVAYAASPWLIGLLVRASGSEAFSPMTVPAGTVTGPPGTVAGPPGALAAPPGAVAGPAGTVPASTVALPAGTRPPRPLLRTGGRVLAVGLVTALAAAVQPGFVLIAAGTGVALAVGLVLGAQRRGALPVAAAGVLGAACAVVLLAPWSLSWRSGPTFTGVAPDVSRALRLATLLRFQTGPIGAGLVGYALLVAAALALIIGREWRSSWAVAMWTLALASFGAAWAGQHHALGVGWPAADLALAPAAVAIAMLAALGLTAFEVDLPAYTFGGRQVVSGIAALALALACLPVIVAAGNGRWHEPTAGYETTLSWMQDRRADGDFRVLWLGAPTVLPIAGLPLDAAVAYATSRNGSPGLTDGWPVGDRGSARQLAQAVTLARRGQTTDLGHLLAPMGIRYIAVAEGADPLRQGTRGNVPVPADLHAGLESQLDLRRVDRSDAVSIYENDAWAPTRVRLPDGAVAAAASGNVQAARGISLQGGTPVLRSGHEPTSFDGPLDSGAAIEVAEAPSGHWSLTVGGQPASRQAAFGVANLFTTQAAGTGRLRYRTPIGWHLAQLLEALVWVGAVVIVVRGRRRRAAPAPGEAQL